MLDEHGIDDLLVDYSPVNLRERILAMIAEQPGIVGSPEYKRQLARLQTACPHLVVLTQQSWTIYGCVFCGLVENGFGLPVLRTNPAPILVEQRTFHECVRRDLLLPLQSLADYQKLSFIPHKTAA